MWKSLKEKLKKTFVYTVYMWGKQTKIRYRNKIRKFRRLRIKYPRQYRKYKHEPINERKVVFIENRLPNLPNSFQLIYNKLANEYDFDLHVHFLRMTFTPKKDHEQRVMDMLKDVATAKYVFISEASNILSCFKMRPETKLIQTWHGCGAFKKFGYSTMDLIFGDNRREMKKYPFHKNYSYVSISSAEVKWAYEEAMNFEPGTEIIVDTGVSRTDIFYDKDFIAAAYEKLYRLMPNARGKKVILYSPTFRGRVAKAQTPNLLNIDMFHENLAEDHVLLIKHHPVVKKVPVIPLHLRDFACDMSKIMSIEELLCVSDLCISDYSSLVYEYSIFEKPMLFFAYDIDEFFDWRGFYYPFDELVPGPVVTTNREMIKFIKNMENFDKGRVHAFRKKFMHRCDGHATERLLKLAMGDDLEKAKKAVPTKGNYSSIPSAAPENKYSVIEKRLSRLMNMKKYATRAYLNHCKQPVHNNRIVVLNDTGALGSDLAYLMERLQVDESFEVIGSALNKASILYVMKAVRLAKKLATAKYVIVSSNVDLINALPIRKETKVIQLWNKSYPLEKFGFDSLETRSGIRNEFMREAKDFNRVDFLTVGSNKVKDIFEQASHLDRSVIKDFGIVRLDALTDSEYQERSRMKLDEMMPKAIGKKVMVYMPTYRTREERPNTAILIDLQRMYENFYKDYVILYYYDSKFVKKTKFDNYYKKFAIDMTEPIVIMELNEKGEEEPVMEYAPLSPLEAMSIADVYIGDYNPYAYDFAVKEKPMFFYADDYKLYFGEKETYFDYEENLPGPIVHDMKELIHGIRDIETYDYSKLRKFKKEFLTNCDGKVTDRLINMMKKN